MTVQSDNWIKKMALTRSMIKPFISKQVRKGKISFGLSSFGYDARVSNEFKVFTNVNSGIVDPKTFKKAKNIILMGGAGFEPGNITPAAEFNIFVDPFAAKSIFESEIEIFMFGLDVTHQMIITPKRLSLIKKSSNSIGPTTADLLTFFNSYDTKKYGWDGAS